MKLFEIWVTIIGVAMSLSYYPQAYSIYKAKSSKNVNLLTYIIFCLGTVTWFAYGILKQDFIVSSGFFFGVIGSWLVLLLLIKYRNK